MVLVDEVYEKIKSSLETVNKIIEEKLDIHNRLVEEIDVAKTQRDQLESAKWAMEVNAKSSGIIDKVSNMNSAQKETNEQWKR